MKDVSVPHLGAGESTISTSILERARNGDHDAFQRISLLYAGLVYHWCRKSGLSPEDSEDVGQRVFMSVSKNLPSFRRDKPGDSFRGWLRVIARSRIADHYRENANRERALGGDLFFDKANEYSLSEEETAGEQQLEMMILYQRAMQLLQGEFAEQDCKAFQMVVMEAISPKDAAERLGVSVNTIYIAKSRVLKRLRDAFEDLFQAEHYERQANMDDR